MNIDTVLSICSKDVFSGLEYGENRILSILAKNGPMNQKEIGILASKYASSFNRWGVKKRLNGSSFHFFGLIPCNYVQTIQINKKETKYGLTVKGLLAVLSQTKFEDIFLIKRFLEFLKEWTSDPKWIDYTLNYIKYEISYLLFYNYIQGIGWTKFRFLKDYLWKTRLKDGYPVLDIGKDIPKDQKVVLETVKQQFGKCILTGDSVLDYVPPKQVMNQLRRMLEKKEPNPKIVKNVILFLLEKYWFYYIDLVEMNKPIKEFFSMYIQVLEPELFTDSTQIARTTKIHSK